MNWSLKIILIHGLLFFLISACSQKHSVDYNFSHKVHEALQFCKTNGLDTQKVILVNYAIPSGKKRLVVWDFTKNEIVYSCIVAQGKCNDNQKFSNLPSSNCSALGRYMVGQKTHSSWGEGFSFKLHGLDSSNYLAYYRFIVLHSADYVPEEEVFPDEIPNSSGCPSVPHSAIHQLKKHILSAKQPILFWVYN